MSAYQDDQRQRARDGQRADADTWQGALALTPQGALAAQAPAGPETEEETEGEYSSLQPISGREVLANMLRSLRGAPPRLWAVIRGLNGEQWAWIAVLALAALLRFWDLGAKALHHDESMHAFYSLLFARDPSSYAYDPLLHGPFQFHAEGFMFALIMAAQNLFHVGGLGNNPWINDTTARFVPALFGLGIVALPLGLRRELGRLGAWLAALLLAVSPAFVYFSRFLREDIYFNFFMFAMVVCAVRFAASRSAKWLTLTIASTVLAYATFEGVYLTLAIFGGFLALLVAWELAGPISRVIPATYTAARRLLLGRVIALLALAGIGMALAAWGLHTMRTLSAYIQANTKITDVQVILLEQRTVAVLLYVSIGIAALVILSLLWQITRENALYDYRQRIAAAEDEAGEAGTETPDADDGEYTDFSDLVEPPAPGWITAADRILGAPGRGIAALRRRADPERQPLLSLLLSTPWTQWFIAFVVGWMLFAGLYWELPTTGRSLGQGFVDGIGKGVWQGLYYWLQQQNVARGAQPVYYYFLLIPLYEQLAVIFGLAGIVYCLWRPTRLRVFLVWWFVGSLGIYSWAGEKMPWLVIHILLSLMLLAAVMLAVTLRAALVAWRGLVAGFASGEARPRLSWRGGGALASTALAALLLVTMVHSMYLLAYRDPANGPLEMMVYVQTTPDVDTVMAKINKADQALHGGKHQLNIVVGNGEEWPFYWYLRDYWMDPHPGTYVTFDPSSYQNMNPDVLILYPGTDVQAFVAAHPKGYHMKEYTLRSWFDEAYKPQLPCQVNKTPCPSNVDYAFYGQGVGPWLSYGSNPPPNATFSLGRAIPRLWNWLWVRQPLGATKGPYYDFMFIVRDGLPIQP